MNEVDWSLVADVFADALERPPADREAFVSARCAGRPEVEAAVRRMLDADAAAVGAFLSGPDPELVGEVLDGVSAPLERVGPWRLVREIGRGGMGRVFLAERADGQFEQHVAVKLLKRGMDSDAILARFLRERQILAGLDHPNIARLLDGGVADDDRPYFVMEHVDGEPITEYADWRRLTVDERLVLFRTVCAAVEHAHRNLVVHRDLKPSNILVTRDGRPKLLDFGIAKLLTADGAGSGAPTLTAEDVRLLTPAYAAPEQLAGGPVTTSTDVYGLGAVLYELLSGRRPFAGHADRLTLPFDTEPITLSSAVRRVVDTTEAATDAEGVAAARATEPERLRRRLAGDLETIVAAALRADPGRRYASVEALDEDVRRHLDHLPVRARPDTFAYRASRFVGRHRFGVAATASIVVLAVTFGVTATAQSRALAVERDRARREAEAAARVTDFMVDVFQVADPMSPGGGDTIRASDLLDRGARRVETELADQPALQSRLLAAIGQAYDNLDWEDRAAPLLERAVEIERARADAEPAALVTALHRLGVVQGNRAVYQEAIPAIREAIEIQDRIAPESTEMWAMQVDLAHMLHGTGDAAAGNEALGRAMDLFERVPYVGSPSERAALSRMASLLGFGEDREREDTVFVRLTEIERRVGGEQSPLYAAALLSWARAKARRGDWAAADSMVARAVEIHRALDPTSLLMANALVERATYALRQGDPERAVVSAREAVDINVRRLGEDHRQVAFVRSSLADALGRVGRHDEAVDQHRRVLRTLTRSEEDAVLVPPTRWRLAVTLRGAGRPDEAAAEFAAALAAFESLFPDDYLLTANVRRDYGDLLVELGRPAEAEPMLRRAIDVHGARWGAEDVRTDMPRVSLGVALVDLGRAGEAATLLGPVAARLTSQRGEADQLARRAREALDRAERSRTR